MGWTHEEYSKDCQLPPTANCQPPTAANHQPTTANFGSREGPMTRKHRALWAFVVLVLRMLFSPLKGAP